MNNIKPKPKNKTVLFSDVNSLLLKGSRKRIKNAKKAPKINAIINFSFKDEQNGTGLYKSNMFTFCTKIIIIYLGLQN